MNARISLRRRVSRALRWLLSRARVAVYRLRPASPWVRDSDRTSYQKRFVDFELPPGSRVVDIGSGGYPFPYASVLVDRFPGSTHHRSDALVRNGKHLVVADIDHLPFQDQHFDYVYCSHVLEHVLDPIAACQEIMRVGRRGFIETPTLAKDMLFAWAKGMHRWHVVLIGQTLCFFEYSDRQAEGIRSGAWRDLIFGEWWHPLQDAFEQNQDLFNVMLTWSGHFGVIALYLDGRIESLNTSSIGRSADGAEVFVAGRRSSESA